MKVVRVARQLEGIADCGNMDCNGCYAIDERRKIHPPRTGERYIAKFWQGPLSEKDTVQGAFESTESLFDSGPEGR